MELDISGLERMGGNIARRLARNVQMIIIHDRTKEKLTGAQPDLPTVSLSRPN